MQFGISGSNFAGLGATGMEDASAAAVGGIGRRDLFRLPSDSAS